MSSTVDLEQDKQSARYAILEASARAFQQNGYQSTSMDDIANEAGVARRTIYHHFKSKKQILEAACIEQAQLFLKEVKQEVEASNDFPTYVVECLLYVIDKAPKSNLFMLDIAQGTGFDPIALYFNNATLIQDWINFFEEPYVEALRNRQINPEIRLEKMVNWFGRISTSYLQYALEDEDFNEIQRSLELFFLNALRFNSN